ncbi:AcrB/AcrD/AcrF family protein, partial [bacterium]|nr:AcrB/AcrD/AcrF family protein [bacterium]
MRLAEYSLNNKTFILFISFVLILAGCLSYVQLGKLEDPEFTIKTALIITQYPGASPQEVEEQVTDEIERAVQKLGQLDDVRSISKAGISFIFVDLKESTRSEGLPQIWDKLRRKIHDMQANLPPGCYPPLVNDDFGDVFGVFLALTGEGFSRAEIKNYAEMIQRELLLVEDVAKVQLWGTQQECINVEISRERMADLGIHPQQVVETLQRQNEIVDAGSLDVGSETLRLTPTGTFRSAKEIGDLVLKGSDSENLTMLGDIATITRDYIDPPSEIMRFNGKPAIGIAVSTSSGGNVITMGEAVKKRIEELKTQLPVGLNFGIVSYQSQDVQDAINTFIVNLIESVAIVIVVLLITMGMRSGLLIGSGLIFTILATMIVMYLFGIDMHRTSLGSLILAMGMLVDNAIVITEGALIRMQHGHAPYDAAVKPVHEMGFPLFGATAIAIFAFLPIYISPNDTGEYCAALFQVTAIALAISWLLAITQTPVFCEMFLRVKHTKQGADPYSALPYRVYHGILHTTMHNRFTTLLLMLVLLFGAMYGFQYVNKMFFPKSMRNQFMIDYWLPEGSRIQSVSQDLHKIEDHLDTLPEVTAYTTCIGSGPPRFYLPYEPELPNSSYGQIIVTVHDADEAHHMIAPIENYLKEHFPQANPRVRIFPLGPSVPFKVEARFSGPDPKVLHQLCQKALAYMRAEPTAKDTRDNWRQKVKVVKPIYSQPRARRVHVSRQNLAMSLRRITNGLPVGLYRMDDELLPILLKAPLAERLQVENLGNMPIYGYAPLSTPLLQVVKDIKVEWEDPIIRRRNRQRTITAQCDPVDDNAPRLEAILKPHMESIPLPEGYQLEWGGESEISNESQTTLFKQLPIAMLLMAIVIVGLFNAFRQPIIIFSILPLSIVGVTFGLLVTGESFGFMALLGTLSLFGMLIKNAVVLLDQIDNEIRSGSEPYQAVVKSSISRVRPVMMASLTTVLAMIPLITDR